MHRFYQRLKHIDGDTAETERELLRYDYDDISEQIEQGKDCRALHAGEVL